MIVGYARTSSLAQVAGLEAQNRELRAAGCDKIFREQVSSVAERQQLEAQRSSAGSLGNDWATFG
jgi:DNA invertase Pin-like site-specific DNA recombinase